MDPVVSCKLPQFEGPLDLLLHLISKNRVDISDIPITLICEQYLDTLDRMHSMDMEIASSFLVMAAQLIYIKSRILLPAPDPEEPQEDPREALANALRTYACFRAQAERLAPDARRGLDRLTRGPLPLPPRSPEAAQQLPYRHKPEDLLRALRNMTRREENRRSQEPGEKTFRELLSAKPVSVEKKARFLMQRLAQSGTLRFAELVRGSQSRSEMVALFLAVLELLGERRIHLGGDATDIGEDELILGAQTMEAPWMTENR